MHKVVVLLVILAVAVNSSSLKEVESFVTGTFSNFKQVYAELVGGNQIHPLGIEKSANANSKMTNLPEGFDGIFVIHEAFYFPASGPMITKPLLFLFEEIEGFVQISSYVSPVPPEDLRNDNFELRIDYESLELSPFFTPSIYTKNVDSMETFYNLFSMTNWTDVSTNFSSVLNETLHKNQLVVLESLYENGQNVVPYSTPMIYDRYNLIQDFPTLMNQLTSNNRVKIVLYYDLCNVSAAGKRNLKLSGIDAVGSSIIDTFEYFGHLEAQPYVAFSETTFVNHPKYGMIYDYVKTRVSQDGTVVASVEYIDPKTFNLVITETITCSIATLMNPWGGVFMYTI